MRKITLIPGDGIGEEVVLGTKDILGSLNLEIEWDIISTPMDDKTKKISSELEKSLSITKVGLKGPLTTPVGEGFRSINVEIRKRFELFANFRPIKTLQGFKTNYKDLDMIIIRENTEDLYAGKELEIAKGVTQSMKIITTAASDRVAKFAFQYALENKRKKITVLHKANIMKLTDGLFLDRVRRISRRKIYKDIEYEELIIDNACMQLVMTPNKFDIILTGNLFGDIVSDLCAGLVGGLGAASGANIGSNYAVFEPVHGTAPDIAGKGIANPLATILSSIMMLNHIDMKESAIKLNKAVLYTLSFPENRMRDMGGKLKTKEFINKIISNIKN